ncbi:MAG: hypothetical protein AB7O04_11895 [Hyphomonadaceae bacterium]
MTLDAATLQKLQAHLAEMRLWVLNVAVTLAEILQCGPLDAWLRKEGRAALHFEIRILRRILIALAYARLPARLLQVSTRRPRNVPSGFRVSGHGNGRLIRRLTKPALKGLQSGDLQTRFQKLSQLLDHLEVAIAKVMRTFLRGPGPMRLAPSAPAAEMFTSAERLAFQGADTS